MEKQGKIFILSGPSGSGKGTVLKSAMKNHPDMFLSVSATTRPPRTGEVDGVHYHFISDDAFLQMVERDELLEHAGYAGNFYGTPRIPVDEALAQGRDVMLEIDVQGAQQIYAKRPDAVRIFLAPPSWTELEHRLVGRGTDSAEKIQQRLRRARDEMALAADYDYFIINDDVERAAAERGITMTDRTEVKHTTLIGSPLHLKRLLINNFSQKEGNAIMMLYPAMNKLTQYIPNRYMMVNVVARRARQIAIEAQRHEEHLDEKPVTLAINEVAEGRFDAKSIDTAISDEA